MPNRRMNISWVVGHGARRIAFITNQVLLYRCGNSVKFIELNSPGGVDIREQTYSADEFASGISRLTSHPYDHSFAVCGVGNNPNIYIYSYPLFKPISTLSGGCKFGYSHIIYSSSVYLATISDNPEFELSIWNVEEGKRLASTPLPRRATPTSASFNPSNWRQIAVLYGEAPDGPETLPHEAGALWLFNIEQCEQSLLINSKQIWLPSVGAEENSLEERATPARTAQASRGSTRIIRNNIELPKTAMAGISDPEMLDEFVEVERGIERVRPVAEVWSESGDLLVACAGSQLVRIEVETLRARMLYNPARNMKLEEESKKGKGPEPESPTEGTTHFADETPPPGHTDTEQLPPGALNTMVFSKHGIYAAGQDGWVRVLLVEGNGVQVRRLAEVGEPVACINVNESYTSLAIGTRGGQTLSCSLERATEGELRPLLHLSASNLVALGALSPGTDYALSVRENGLVELANLNSGRLVSSISVNEQATALACNPRCKLVVVGTVSGRLHFIDFSKVQHPRQVNAMRLFRQPVQYLEYDQYGDFLVSTSTSGKCFILTGSVSHSFGQVVGHTAIPNDIKGLSLYRSSDSAPLEILLCARLSSKKYSTTAYTRFVYFTVPLQVLRGDRDPDAATALYSNAELDLRQEVIGKFSVNMPRLCTGSLLAAGRTMYTLCTRTKRILKIALPMDINCEKKEVKQVSILSSVAAHEMATEGQLSLSFDHRILLSYASDGRVCIRFLDAPSSSTSEYESGEGATSDRTVMVQCANHLAGGVRFARFTRDAHYLLCCGHDQFLYCYRWDDPSVIERVREDLAHYLNDAEHSSIARMEEETLQSKKALSPVVSSANTQVSLSTATDPPAPVQTSESTASAIFITPLPVAPPDPTWLEETHVTAILNEDKGYVDMKRSLRADIDDIKKTLAQLIARNEEVPDLEKLVATEFNLDVEEAARAEAEAEQASEGLRERQERANLTKRFLRDLIRHECYDEMSVKGRGIRAFVTGLEVQNYPLKARSHEELEHIQTIIERRKLEMLEKKRRAELTEEKEKGPQTVEQMIRDKFNLKSDEEQEEETPTEEKKEKSMLLSTTDKAVASVAEFLYDQFELVAREQKLNQIVLLNDMIYRMKEAFNRDFDDLFLRKEQEMFKIRDKNKRINKILADLDLLSEIQADPEWTPLEKPDRNFIVEDSEIKAEKYLSPEQQKRLEEEQRREEEARAAARADNWRERGLDQMMGGVLEVKKEDELKKDIPLPGTFILPVEKGGKPIEEWTDEEQRAAKEYERKCKELQEERDKYHKQLEMELKKLQSIIEDARNAFDEQLSSLFTQRIKTELLVYEAELHIERAHCSMLLEEEFEVCERALHASLTKKRALKLLYAQRAADARKAVDNYQSLYDTWVAEDKVLEKSFKREFSDLSSQTVDLLFKLYKKRPRRVQKSEAALAAQEFSVNNPYQERPPTARVNQSVRTWLDTAMQELDAPSNMPDSAAVDERVWKRLCEARRRKLDSEQAIKQAAHIGAEMKAYQQRRVEDDERLRLEIHELEIDLEKLKDDKNRYIYNLQIQLNLKQGQVELDSSPFVPDFKDAIFIDRKVVEDLNTKIKELADHKIQSMEESKDFKRGIVQLQWERRKMQMEFEDLIEKKRDIQMMKVTREIQTYLSSPDTYEQQIAADIQKLEQTVQKLREHQQDRVEVLERELDNVSHDIKSKANENDALSRQADELNVLRSERFNINQVNADNRNALDVQQRKYTEIVQRRRLIELAKQQAQEIAVLRAEVERLRMRTFPALVQLE